MELLATSKPLALLLLIVIFAALFLRVRRASARSPWQRGKAFAIGACCIGLAIFLGVWGPPRIPDTPGSPAALVFWLILITFAGITGVFGLVFLLGALFGWRRRS